MPNWLLPENIADILPPEARKIEDLRRRLLDHFRLYGYELVIPPLLEYLESLLPDASEDLDLRTFKLIDQLSGRTLGVRADMTIQVARIDAHLLNRKSVTRVCYTGSVLHTRPTGLFATREPIQIGAEIYGHAGLEADLEIQALLLASLSLAGITQVRMDLGHIAIFRAILERDPIAKQNELALYGLLGSKDITGLNEIAKPFKEQTRLALVALTDLYGDVSVLEKARAVLPAFPEIQTALNELTNLVSSKPKAVGVDISIDLGDVRGLHYHSGVTFAAYVKGCPNAVARGGRYDHVGESFGRARPATGFSLDLRELSDVLPLPGRQDAILAPWSNDPDLRDLISVLRARGEIVIQSLPGHTDELDEFECTRTIELIQGTWIIKEKKRIE